MAREVNSRAGQPAGSEILLNVPELVTAYYTERPDPSVPEQRVIFGTSGHRGSSLDQAFNERHILAITQAICRYRQQQRIDGPLFLGMDTHALSVPAFASAMEVLTANEVEVMIAPDNEYTPTPTVSHAILTYNRGRRTGLADGIVITPSHNPPRDGGFKYNPPNGGPAEPEVSDCIEAQANTFLENTHAMQRLIGLKDRFDIAFACDTDHDRHGIVTRSTGLLAPNHYLSAAIFYLFQHRPAWRPDAAVGKTVVSSAMIDRVAAKLSHRLYEVPVGFKSFVEGLLDGSLGFGGEESAGASFLRRDGSVWTTDKDGIVAALLAAEIVARMDRDPGTIYRDLTREFGTPVYDRIEASAAREQKEILEKISAPQIKVTDLAGEKVEAVLTHAPGNDAPLGGVKVVAQSGWFAARPSGTEEIYRIYAESFLGEDHLHRILEEAQLTVKEVLTPSGQEQGVLSATG